MFKRSASVQSGMSFPVIAMLALIPCKGLDAGKSRLAGHLDALSRRSLCEFLLRRTLTLATEAFSPECIRLVTPDATAAAIGLEFEIRHIEDEGCGLNRALVIARTTVLDERTRSCRVLILPTDLPCATKPSLERLLEYREDVVIVPDQANSATNALLLTAEVYPVFSFAFGRGSYQLHLSQAQQAGQSVRSVTDERLTFDLDRPCQYDRWIGDHGSALSLLVSGRHFTAAGGTALLAAGA